APHGPATLAEALRRLAPTRIELADIGLRRPSLDDVFLSLTGHTAGADAQEPTTGEPA
ncbi:daunorubicin/doxorubicin resistance ABC transporter ATP-binding protein DrrA, partial [Rhodococcus ruber]|nr:daunorubicin/doxorubicin resistance ABC transporter ATP-binding protein DrrA [Rhodococcus ruber]